MVSQLRWLGALLGNSLEGSCPSRSSTASCFFLKAGLALCSVSSRSNPMWYRALVCYPPRTSMCLLGAINPKAWLMGRGAEGRYPASKASKREVPDPLSRFEPTHLRRNGNACAFYTQTEFAHSSPCLWWGLSFASLFSPKWLGSWQEATSKGNCFSPAPRHGVTLGSSWGGIP